MKQPRNQPRRSLLLGGFVVVAGFAVMAAACGPQQQTQEMEPAPELEVIEQPVVDDATVMAEVHRRLNADPAVSEFTVQAESVDGVVTLRGQVENEEARSAAASVAAGTEGVERVVNDIEVVPEGTAKGRLNDAWITTKIKSKLAADPQVNPFNIDVDTKDRVVTLSGTVENEVARSEAEKHATGTKGVTAVVNQIEVEVKEQAGDEQS